MSNDTIKISDLAILMDKAKKYDELLIINKKLHFILFILLIKYIYF